MQLFGPIYRAVEHVSTAKAAAIGGAGSGVSFATAALADPSALSFIDPLDVVPWLQVATLTVGFLTGLVSLALVAMKLVQQGRDMRS